jgi:hypothetical protein
VLTCAGHFLSPWCIWIHLIVTLILCAVSALIIPILQTKKLKWRVGDNWSRLLSITKLKVRQCGCVYNPHAGSQTWQPSQPSSGVLKATEPWDLPAWESYFIVPRVIRAFKWCPGNAYVRPRHNNCSIRSNFFIPGAVWSMQSSTEFKVLQWKFPRLPGRGSHQDRLRLGWQKSALQEG